MLFVTFTIFIKDSVAGLMSNGQCYDSNRNTNQRGSLSEEVKPVSGRYFAHVILYDATCLIHDT